MDLTGSAISLGGASGRDIEVRRDAHAYMNPGNICAPLPATWALYIKNYRMNLFFQKNESYYKKGLT